MSHKTVYDPYPNYPYAVAATSSAYSDRARVIARFKELKPAQDYADTMCAEGRNGVVVWKTTTYGFAAPTEATT